MNRMIRRTAFVTSVAVLALAGLAAAEPGVARRLDLDFWNLPAFATRIASASRTAADLDVLSAAVRERIAAKEQVAANLIDGRVSLREAAERFHRLDDSVPLDRGSLERLCQNVVRYTRNALA